MKWSPLEDKMLQASVEHYGSHGWAVVAQAIPGRTGKQCRERWVNQLDPTLNAGVWTPEEDQVLMSEQRFRGNAWVQIALALPKRSPNSIKNRWTWLTKHRQMEAEALLMGKGKGEAGSLDLVFPVAVEGLAELW
jgi:hypothetical protein